MACLIHRKIRHVEPAVKFNSSTVRLISKVETADLDFINNISVFQVDLDPGMYSSLLALVASDVWFLLTGSQYQIHLGFRVNLRSSTKQNMNACNSLQER